MKHRGKHRHFQTKIKKITENSFLAEQKNDFEKLNQKMIVLSIQGSLFPAAKVYYQCCFSINVYTSW